MAFLRLSRTRVEPCHFPTSLMRTQTFDKLFVAVRLMKGDELDTPRRGKAVEINALWYNALRLLSGWLDSEAKHEQARELDEHSARAYESFNARFWCAERDWLYDVIDGEGPDSARMRPNQLFAISLTHPVLATPRWPAVLGHVQEQLLTPMGLRSLGPAEPEYKPRYDGDLRSRDAAYHQGTVWAWLIGPFIDAYLRVYPEERDKARQLLLGFCDHLNEACVGSISEVFDAENPFNPRGCIAQAWSVAEVLRCWLLTESEKCEN